MNHCRQTIAIIFTLSASVLHAMEQQQLENPFQALNDDPGCPITFKKYNHRKHQALLKMILERGETWKSLINPNGDNLALIMHTVKHPCGKTSGDCTIHQYLILQKNTNKAIGFIDWRAANNQDRADLNSLAVDELWRRQGIGTLAIYATLAWEQARGTQYFSTEYIFDNNTTAIQFFKSMGCTTGGRCQNPNSNNNCTYYDMQDLQNKDLEPILKKLQDKNLISKSIHYSSKTMSTSPLAPKHKPASTTVHNSRAQITHMLSMTGKVLFAAGLVMKFASATRYAPLWLQQRSRSAYAITALGGLCYGASRLMRT